MIRLNKLFLLLGTISLVSVTSCSKNYFLFERYSQDISIKFIKRTARYNEEDPSIDFSIDLNLPLKDKIQYYDVYTDIGCFDRRIEEGNRFHTSDFRKTNESMKWVPHPAYLNNEDYTYKYYGFIDCTLNYNSHDYGYFLIGIKDINEPRKRDSFVFNAEVLLKITDYNLLHFELDELIDEAKDEFICSL